MNTVEVIWDSNFPFLHRECIFASGKQPSRERINLIRSDTEIASGVFGPEDWAALLLVRSSSWKVPGTLAGPALSFLSPSSRVCPKLYWISRLSHAFVLYSVPGGQNGARLAPLSTHMGKYVLLWILVPQMFTSSVDFWWLWTNVFHMVSCPSFSLVLNGHVGSKNLGRYC